MVELAMAFSTRLQHFLPHTLSMDALFTAQQRGGTLHQPSTALSMRWGCSTFVRPCAWQDFTLLVNFGHPPQLHFCFAHSGTERTTPSSLLLLVEPAGRIGIPGALSTLILFNQMMHQFEEDQERNEVRSSHQCPHKLKAMAMAESNSSMQSNLIVSVGQFRADAGLNKIEVQGTELALRALNLNDGCCFFGLFLLSVSSHFWCKADFCNTLRDTVLICDESNCNDIPCFKKSIQFLYTPSQKLKLVNKALSMNCSLTIASAFLGVPKSTLKSWMQNCKKVAQ